ncbi:MAG: hypothetical protein A3E98_02340 [Candidatus Doudnabacteria bacterium RIFCSPHIGHO2_12_FULL_48_11]|uniref:Uncharacterized protein n=1 Tax=Candidatus Doudnabacteria bacterium RIFCSPHIGHO2_01_FULL_46_24 TaxID=1817825 RepID=A0A1F5NUC2_9BACT|nr:MAG: hypothetical protein A2720_01320 [Candidatus Doudnabacteria bacterium RIFCSPHIGHO2_01_FULL_46_24]OGE96064.1 MAG: hypothetical protein A3E98_02340 [Candidatus Doudnabacteria bacterium RIFCSPHIGHO2_12_FULL_48_11]
MTVHQAMDRGARIVTVLAMALLVVFAFLALRTSRNAQRKLEESRVEALKLMPDNCAEGSQPVSEKIFENPREAFRCVAPFLDQPWVENRLLEAMHPDPYWALVMYDHYQGEYWAHGVFRQAIRLDPEAAFYFFSYELTGGQHSLDWWEKRIPGVVGDLRKMVIDSVPQRRTEAAKEFLAKMPAFPQREQLLARIDRGLSMRW